MYVRESCSADIRGTKVQRFFTRRLKRGGGSNRISNDLLETAIYIYMKHKVLHLLQCNVCQYSVFLLFVALYRSLQLKPKPSFGDTMHLKQGLFLALYGLATTVKSTNTNSTKPEPFGLFGDNSIYWPDANHTIFYPRITELSDGTILATAGLNSSPKPVFPIFSSSDGGASWEWISNMTDQVNGLGMNAQPALAELTFDLSDSLPAGTVLASGNSWSPISDKNSTNIDIYASRDKGRTWEFVSNVARGSGPNTTNGTPCIWEPYIL